MNRTGYVPRQKFTKEEDDIIKKKWSEKGDKCIPELIQILGRNRKQIRDRYFFYLAPGLDNGPFTAEDDCILAKLVSKYGYKWTYFTKFLKGKGTNDVKNRWRLFTSRIKDNDFQKIYRMVTNKNISPFVVEYIQGMKWDSEELPFVPNPNFIRDITLMRDLGSYPFDDEFDSIIDAEALKDNGKPYNETYKEKMEQSRNREGILLSTAFQDIK